MKQAIFILTFLLSLSLIVHAESQEESLEISPSSNKQIIDLCHKYPFLCDGSGPGCDDEEDVKSTKLDDSDFKNIPVSK